MKSFNIDKALNKFKRIKNNNYGTDALSEADTRAKKIDKALEALGWTEHDIVREERCIESGTFLDYKISTNRPKIIIEAKKSEISFNLPKATHQREFKIGGVLRNCKSLVLAMKQAQEYAVSKGCPFCVVSNGEQYVFFRSYNDRGVDWNDQMAIIFRGLTDIEENFDLFCSALGKQSTEDGIISQTIKVSESTDNIVDQFRTLDTSHLTRPRKKDRNNLYPIIGAIVEKSFQDLSTEEAETELLEHCYVDSPRKGEKSRPYLDIAVQELTVSKKDAGDFQQRILSALKQGNKTKSETTLLLGSVGVGKSTFIQRFRKVLAKREIDADGIWIYFDFKKYSGTGQSLDAFIFQEISDALNEQYSQLNLDEWSFLKQAYHSEYERLKKGPLAPVFKDRPDEFEEKFGERLEDQIAKNQPGHFIRILTTATKRLNKAIFFAFDNADQLSPEIQNNIFLAAQSLSSKIPSFTLLAMREESYWKNRDSGPLNAFHTTAYHVQPASLNQVLSKRFQYAKLLLKRENQESRSGHSVKSSELLAVFERLTQTLLGSDKRFIEFIESTAAKDTRRALENVAAFLVSGHTNIDAILKDIRKSNPRNLTIPFHEFLDAAILRDHELFSESECDILNLFNVSGTSDASNFNRTAVLGRICKARNNKSPVGNGYVSIDQVIDDCEKAGILSETTQDILSLLNSRRLIETETTIKDTVEDSKYVRATISGEYYLEKLCLIFGYMDTVVRATPIIDKRSFDKLENLERQISNLSTTVAKDRLKRVELRLKIADGFVSYLESEISKSKYTASPELFCDSSINIAERIRKSFNSERPDILSRAKQIFGG